MDLNPVLFPQVTNRESVQQIIGLYDADTGEAIDLTDLTFQLEVRRTGLGSNCYSAGYGSSSDIGVSDSYGRPEFTLTLDDGLEVIDTGMLQMSITVDQMRTLTPDTYSIAMTASNGVDTRQVFLGMLPVLFGGVA